MKGSGENFRFVAIFVTLWSTRVDDILKEAAVKDVTGKWK